MLKQLVKSFKSIYDIFCFGPLWIEHLIEQRPRKPKMHIDPEVHESNLVESSEALALDDNTDRSNTDFVKKEA